jgi:PAS domain S-box-containing protein
MQFRYSLRTRLLLLISAAVLPLFAFALLSAWREADAALERTQRQLRFTAELLAAQQDNLTESTEHLLASIAAVPDVKALDAARCGDYFSTLRGRLPTYANIGLLDGDGNVVCHANGAAAVFNAADRSYFRGALRDKAFTVGQPVMGRSSAVRVLPYGYPVLDADRVVGVAFASLNLSQPETILGRVQVPAGVRLVVADREGQVLASMPPVPDATIRNPRVLQAARDLQAGQGEAETPDAGGAWRIYAHAPSNAVRGQGFLAIASIDRLVVTSPAYAELHTNLLALAAALAASLALAWWFGGRAIVRPTDAILRTAGRLEAGDLDARAPERGRRDAEFARIAGALNRLAAAVQVREQRLEQELERSRRAHDTLGMVLNTMQEGLLATDASGKVIIENAASMAIFRDAGLPPSAWPERYGVYHPDRFTLMGTDEIPLVRALRGESGHALVWIRNEAVPDGRLLQCSFRPIGDAAAPQGGLAVFVDVTRLDRLQQEQAGLVEQLAELNADLERRVRERTEELERQEARFRTLAEQAPEVIWNTAPTGELTYINRRWAELVGGEAEDWLGFRWLRKIHPDDVGAVTDAWEQARASRSVYTGIRRVAALDGSWHTMAFRATPVLDEAGDVQFWVGVDTDITEHKRNEARLRGANRELEGFTYAVSHDLRAPLAAISGFGEALAEKLAGHPDAKVSHYLARIRVGAERIDELISALLSLSQFGREPLRLTLVDLGEMAQDIVDGLREAEPGRSVTTRIEPGLLVKADTRLVRVLLQNLLQNAWKFTARTQQGHIEVGRTDTEEGPAFYVRDNGAGFDMDRAGRLFVPFQRLHDSSDFPGTGIGLATVQRVALIHGGHVWAHSAPGGGATFFFVLQEAGGS